MVNIELIHEPCNMFVFFYNPEQLKLRKDGRKSIAPYLKNLLSGH